MTQPTIELLPCPFCGSAGAIHANGIGDYYVRCNLCEAATDQARCEEPEHAAKRWNTRAALTAQAGDGNRLPLEEVPEGWKLAWISHGKFGDAKFCAQIKRVDSHIAPNVRYAYRATPAEALRAAIRAAKDGVG